MQISLQFAAIIDESDSDLLWKYRNLYPHMHGPAGPGMLHDVRSDLMRRYFDFRSDALGYPWVRSPNLDPHLAKLLRCSRARNRFKDP
jgi:hypothetical protein